jgi:hypothetical protein
MPLYGLDIREYRQFMLLYNDNIQFFFIKLNY